MNWTWLQNEENCAIDAISTDYRTKDQKLKLINTKQQHAIETNVIYSSVQPEKLSNRELQVQLGSIYQSLKVTFVKSYTQNYCELLAVFRISNTF